MQVDLILCTQKKIWIAESFLVLVLRLKPWASWVCWALPATGIHCPLDYDPRGVCVLSEQVEGSWSCLSPPCLAQTQAPLSWPPFGSKDRRVPLRISSLFLNLKDESHFVKKSGGKERRPSDCAESSTHVAFRGRGVAGLERWQGCWQGCLACWMTQGKGGLSKAHDWVCSREALTSLAPKWVCKNTWLWVWRASGSTTGSVGAAMLFLVWTSGASTGFWPKSKTHDSLLRHEPGNPVTVPSWPQVPGSVRASCALIPEETQSLVSFCFLCRSNCWIPGSGLLGHSLPLAALTEIWGSRAGYSTLH